MPESIATPRTGPLFWFSKTFRPNLSGLRGRFLLLMITIILGVGSLAAFGFFQVASQIINNRAIAWLQLSRCKRG